MIKNYCDMYILVRELWVFITAVYLKSSEVLARPEQLRRRFLYRGKVLIVHFRGNLKIYCIYDLGKIFVHCRTCSLENKGFSESLKAGVHCRTYSL
jgi:hypothetical protein